MCGLLAWRAPLPPWAAPLAAARGPHSHGIALPGQGVVRGDGPLRTTPDPGTGWALAHSRLATRTDTPGGVPDAAEAQPLERDGWVIAHNGDSAHPLLTSGHAAPADSRGLLALVVERGLDALLWASEQGLLEGQPQAVLLRDPDGMLHTFRAGGTHRPAHPLWLDRQRRWVSSRRLSHDDELIPVGLYHIGATPV